jgi:hypothetical protein
MTCSGFRLFWIFNNSILAVFSVASMRFPFSQGRAPARLSRLEDVLIEQFLSAFFVIAG